MMTELIALCWKNTLSSLSSVICGKPSLAAIAKLMVDTFPSLFEVFQTGENNH